MTLLSEAMRPAAPRTRSWQTAAATAGPAKLDWSTTLLLWGILLGIAGLLFGWFFLSRYRHAQVHDEQFRSKYHLSEGQLASIRVLAQEHLLRYRPLVERAEATTRDLEMRVYPGIELDAEARAIVAQAQREREDCWTEEMLYHRLVGGLMTAEDGRRYLAAWEARYQARKNAPNGLLVLPHR